ncbi:unnamed protein product, partial [Nippostrongylus brasiliensis]|uniref:Amino acid transporter n=1 Tax=Nippostrongylus brasiliensis TaxID=27835 RepID=A0A0N4YK40_NIPBR
MTVDLETAKKKPGVRPFLRAKDTPKPIFALLYGFQVSPLMLLLAFSQVNTMVDKISLHWVAVVQAVTLFITILYLADVLVPLPGIKYGKLHWYRTNLFGQYPYLIAIVISWAFCLFLTVTDLVEAGGPARGDI